MTIEQWLSDVYQDTWMGKNIYNKETDGSSQIIAEIRGWGAIQYLFKTKEEAEQFQDEVGKFIVEAIREKIATNSQTERMYSEKEVIKFLDKREDYVNETSSIIDYQTAKEWFEQFKKK
jgi:hypothetical protein